MWAVWPRGRRPWGEPRWPGRLRDAARRRCYPCSQTCPSGPENRSSGGVQQVEEARDRAARPTGRRAGPQRRKEVHTGCITAHLQRERTSAREIPSPHRALRPRRGWLRHPPFRHAAPSHRAKGACRGPRHPCRGHTGVGDADRTSIDSDERGRPARLGRRGHAHPASSPAGRTRPGPWAVADFRDDRSPRHDRSLRGRRLRRRLVRRIRSGDRARQAPGRRRERRGIR